MSSDLFMFERNIVYINICSMLLWPVTIEIMNNLPFINFIQLRFCLNIVMLIFEILRRIRMALAREHTIFVS